MVIAILGAFAIAACSVPGSNNGNGGGGTGPAVVNLGTAANYVILSKAGIADVPASAITGNIGVSPATLTGITGFTPAPAADVSGQFYTATEVTGKIYAAGMAVPTPATMTAAVADMLTAYTDAATRTAAVGANLNIGAGTVTGVTLAPGLYSWGTNVGITGNITLSGGANDTWILQITGNLSVANGVHVALSGGAQAKNVVWQVAGATTLGTTSQVPGIILCQTAITLNTGASLTGRLFAQTAVTVGASTITQP
jgi:hypothetical protein